MPHAPKIGRPPLPDGRAVVRSRTDELRRDAVPVIQTALAAALAWVIAHDLLGNEQPFFAPIAATIVLGVTLAQRGRRTLEMVLGVTLGIAVGDLLISLIGTGAPQIALFVVIAMVVARALGGGPLVIGQSAASAVLVATLPAPDGAFDFSRSLDALVGGGCALLLNAVLPVDPVARARSAAGPVLRELAEVLEETAGALEDGDEDRASDALLRARALDAPTAALREQLTAGRETARWAPTRRPDLDLLERWQRSADHVDLAVRNVRVLARGALRAVSLEDNVPPALAHAVRELAVAVRALEHLIDGDDVAAEAREAAITAAGRATLVLERTGNLSVNVLVGQVRFTAVDLLRSLGMEREEAVEAVRAAAEMLELAEAALDD